MSRIGKKPVKIVKDVTVTQKADVLNVKGKLGEMTLKVHPNMKIEFQGDEVIVTRPDDTKENKSLHGLTRALLQNMVKGVSEGYTKQLDIVGVGYKAEAKGEAVLFNLGFSHPIYFIPPTGIKMEVVTPTQVKVSGFDKELVGMVAAKIRSFKKPEPYKGKGVKYSTEKIIRKAGKTAGK
ncbi:MAG: 50S ribosomal protein L6 [Stygiobacter sp. RIFOXYC12_FULL_38_8]|nr:MAG: 50S ribosomal protein L6 [Stygiobacter sp. GWC2_38_9]OGU82129.1 MAG: 50S ribosomal protein L6 [Stygiobacter sp. RIFOXYA12_FULL_38_9]OGV08872.1 MAG: 50S ribosomal protein L6 [Stygiobacter sp. RIFOXYB2_FULL_37_11]OGV15537.1 MAG: 50S ribosomal protein L6 [Stygiobacter sp. RIFOXYC2_FULL_38_25]OGV16495.1 MAG: 50S ribosomal protein L6 [Stygiobacter sp. RIFOXYA2_FULL_38_8]OGV25475.1 MAG: 50S ribosomal protein L6 [Stygiobacter sp. RIFOXYC12_FULL_38_8]OGV80652.1 MAG: 50S ribosomal protein L6 [